MSSNNFWLETKDRLSISNSFSEGYLGLALLAKCLKISRSSKSRLSLLTDSQCDKELSSDFPDKLFGFCRTTGKGIGAVLVFSGEPPITSIDARIDDIPELPDLYQHQNILQTSLNEVTKVKWWNMNHFTWPVWEQNLFSGKCRWLVAMAWAYHYHKEWNIMKILPQMHSLKPRHLELDFEMITRLRATS